MEVEARPRKSERAPRGWARKSRSVPRRRAVPARRTAPRPRAPGWAEHAPSYSSVSRSRELAEKKGSKERGVTNTREQAAVNGQEEKNWCTHAAAPVRVCVCGAAHCAQQDAFTLPRPSNVQMRGGMCHARGCSGDRSAGFVQSGAPERSTGLSFCRCSSSVDCSAPTFRSLGRQTLSS